MHPAMLRPRPALRAFAVATFCFITAMLTSGAPAGAQQSTPPAASSILAGAYTSAQAVRGQRVFADTCGNCHGRAEFTGTGFQRKWSGQSVFSLFSQLRDTMPLDNPGGLTREQYAAVIAYLLQLNAYPTGDAELPAADEPLRALRFEAKPAGNR
jgi:mono/diheme cytochrome c family protein